MSYVEEIKNQTKKIEEALPILEKLIDAAIKAVGRVQEAYELEVTTTCDIQDLRRTAYLRSLSAAGLTADQITQIYLKVLDQPKNNKVQTIIAAVGALMDSSIVQSLLTQKAMESLFTKEEEK